MTGEPRALSLIQSNLLIYERHKNLWHDPECSRVVGDRNGKKGDWLCPVDFDFAFVFLPNVSL
jgi:hypothetical protein